MKAAIIDGYVDEPAHLGVPPFISAYARYAHAVYAYFGVDAAYYTIDQIREKDLWSQFDHLDQIMVIGGTTVPGKYVAGNPLQWKEISILSQSNPHPLRIFSGTMTFGFANRGRLRTMPVLEELRKAFDCVITGNLETFLFHLLHGDNPEESIPREDSILRTIAVHLGSLLPKHPLFPYVINEIELSTGCERKEHCSFCTEPVIYPVHAQRTLASIQDEIQSIAAYGGRYLRLGRATNILAYGGSDQGPNPETIEHLYQMIRESVPGLKVLHTDNAHVGYMAKYPKACQMILETIARYNTPGDGLSLGIESFDERVLKKNNKGFSRQQAFDALKMINAIGAIREKGIPKLLPGINLLFGLIGESLDTYSINQEALQLISKQAWMVRRVNIRQAMIFPGTPLANQKPPKNNLKSRNRFYHFKEWVRKEFDHPMLKKVFPEGTHIEEVIPEYHDGMITFGRPLGSYPILIGIREKIPLGSPVNVQVTEHGYRSITGVLVPSIGDSCDCTKDARSRI